MAKVEMKARKLITLYSFYTPDVIYDEEYDEFEFENLDEKIVWTLKNLLPYALTSYEDPAFRSYLGSDHDRDAFRRPSFQVCKIHADKPLSIDNIAIYQMKLYGDETYSYYPKHYTKLLNSDDNDEILLDIKKLFRDYIKPKAGLFLAGNWNRHHFDAARRIIDQLPDSTEEAFNFLVQQRRTLADTKPKLNFKGSFMRRIDFAIAQLAGELDKQLEATSQPVSRI